MKKSQSSDYINGLEKSLGVDKEGNLTAWKNLELDGTTKLNGGLKPIHTYNFKDEEENDYVLNTFLETNDNVSIGFIGELSLIGYDQELCLGKYTLLNGKINSLSVIYCINNSANPKFEFYSREGENDFLFYDYAEYADKRNSQSKLYTHTLTLTAGTNNYVLVYDSTNNTSANNIQNLRTLMNVISASDSVILPVVNSTDLSTAGLQVTTSICKIGTANVTAVSDKVTAL